MRRNAGREGIVPSVVRRVSQRNYMDDLMMKHISSYTAKLVTFKRDFKKQQSHTSKVTDKNVWKLLVSD